MEVTKGVVLDYASKKPIAKVKVYAKRRAYRPYYTDSLGNFEVSFVTGFFEKNGCQKHMCLVLAKSGYDSLEVHLKNKPPNTTLPDTVFLRKK
jgi:hypothetical protein